MSVILNPNEASRLNASQRNLLNSFIAESDPETFKKSGDLDHVTILAGQVIKVVVESNPHWETIPKNPCPALMKERAVLLVRRAELKNSPLERRSLHEKIKSIDQKIDAYNCDLEKTDLQAAKKMRQWDCDKISAIKKRLSAAVQLQREYYDTTWMGAISKFFFKLICPWNSALWNNGDTSEIEWALETLYRWDFVQPLSYVGRNRYVKGNDLKNIYYPTHLDSEQIGTVPWLKTSWIKQHLKTNHLYNEPLSQQITIIC